MNVNRRAKAGPVERAKCNSRTWTILCNRTHLQWGGGVSPRKINYLCPFHLQMSRKGNE